MALTTFVAAYDVSDDRRRARLAALMQAHGDRVQKSVFVIVIADDELEEFRVQIAKRVDPDEDSVYLARQCGACWETLECIGQATEPPQDLFWAVM